MRTITTIRLRADGGARADAIVRHLRDLADSDRHLDAAALAGLVARLPPEVRAARGSRIPAPDHEAIEQVLVDHGLQPGSAVFAQGADALSLICQATPGELHTDGLIGGFTISTGAGAVHGILSRGPAAGVLQARLRGAPAVVYAATEALIKEVAHVDPGIGAQDVLVVAKERESDEVFEQAQLDLIRRRSMIGVLSSAVRQRMIDPALLSFALIVAVGVALSWVIHFHPAAVGMSHWSADDVNWVDGWIGRLASAASFGLVTGLGILVTTVRRAAGDGVYVGLTWRRPAP